MVGRDEELQSLDKALSAAQAGRGGAVFVAGESGIGKSRLAKAAADHAFEVGLRVLRGRGSSIGPMVPYRPLSEALMPLTRPGTPIDFNQLGPYRSILARLIPDWGTPSAPEEGGSVVVLAEAVLRLTTLAGQHGGCLLILDDMQDFDPETLAVVDYLADNLDQQPTLLLGTVRTDPCPALDLVRSASQRGSGTLVQLNRLGPAELRRLAGSCLECTPGEVPAEVTGQLWTSSEGIPLVAEELLRGMCADGLLVRDGGRWQVTGPLQTKVPVPLARSVARRLDMIGPDGRRLLSVAAVLGRRFPFNVLQEATGMDDRELLNHLYSELTSQFVAQDEETADWYAFAHPLLRDVLLGLLTPAERGLITGQAIAAIEAVFPGLPGEWCQVSATLHRQAGHQAQAGQLFAEAGRRALAQGAAQSAVTLLDEALTLLAEGGDAQGRAAAFASLLLALTEAGLVERAVASAGELEQMAGLLSRQERASLHTRLAWTAMVAGRSADGLAQVDIARELLGSAGADQDVAAVDVVAAHLVLDLPGPDQVGQAEALARRGAEVAESCDLPVLACQAWQLLGSLTRSRSPEEATGCLERARQIAVLHDLQVEEIHALLRLGNDDALRTASTDRLEQARRQAAQAGAVMSRYQAESSIALYFVLRGDFTAAGALLDQVLESTKRLKLMETTRYSLLVRAIMAAHRGRRRDMEDALADLRGWGGDLPQYVPRIQGLARTWCALLEEDQPKAREELSAALAAEQASPTYLQLTGRYGLHLLLRALDGTVDWEEYRQLTAEPISKLRWDRQFSLFARAVMAGRDGQGEQAAETVTEALAVAAPYATARHLALRLVSQTAITDGWGTPVEWLRACDEYFHAAGVTPVASACRTLMRQTGAPVGQRRRGLDAIPAPLRAYGVTVREYEIMQLVTERLSNKEIAARLHLSTRTVENHIASLLTKTGQPDRFGLGELGTASRRQPSLAKPEIRGGRPPMSA
jgi:DNA-binding CsgD family transcriptional regulator/tetratricopeptide (TPR) repeat protein